MSSSLTRCLVLCVCVSAAGASRTQAQTRAQRPFRLVSVDAVAALRQGVAAEYEHCLDHRSLGCLLTAGVGVAAGADERDRGLQPRGQRRGFADGDVFLRVRPSGDDGRLSPWAFGLRTGVTQVGGRWPRVAVGADLTRGWQPMRHLHVGTAGGIRVLGVTDAASGITVVPTLRLTLGIAY